MDDIGSVGRALPFYILWPAITAFIVVIALVIRQTPSRAGRFVIFAVAFRFMASALHEVTYTASPLGLSWNALASIAVVAVGVFMVRKRAVFDYAVVPFYPLTAVLLASGLMNAQPADLATALTKYAYLMIVILATVDALDDLGLERLFRRLLWAFTLPVGLQLFSILLGYAKPGETNGADSYIGGFYHEAAFSLVLCSGLLVTCLLRDLKLRAQLPLILLFMAGIFLANYRTAVLGVLPLIVGALVVSVPQRFHPRQRALVVGAAALLAVGAIGLGAVVEADRFSDLGVAVAEGPSLIKQPGTFSTEERRLLSGRFSIWSNYIYAWRDATPAQQLIGFGPETWGRVFTLYAHNTLVSALYEIGVIGIAAVLFLWGWMLALACFARGAPRVMLAFAHVGFFTLNMATMPMWMIEGMIFYGLLCGYTVYAFRHRTSRSSALPELQLELPQSKLAVN